MQSQPPKSDKRRNIEASLLRSINQFHQAVMARSSVLRLMVTFGLTELGIPLSAVLAILALWTTRPEYFTSGVYKVWHRRRAGMIRNPA
jgi:hypothetical protein